jgi:hypothetical protein
MGCGPGSTSSASLAEKSSATDPPRRSYALRYTSEVRTAAAGHNRLSVTRPVPRGHAADRTAMRRRASA